MTGKVRSPEERLGDKLRAALLPVERDVLMQAIDQYAGNDEPPFDNAREDGTRERVARMLGYRDEEAAE
jgi:hypothetical protein